MNNKKQYAYLDIVAPGTGEFHSVASIRAQAGDSVSKVKGQYFYNFGTFRYGKMRVMIKKREFVFYKSLSHVRELVNETGEFYTFTENTFRTEIKTLKDLLIKSAERGNNQLIGLDDLVRIQDILNGNPNKKDYLIFDNAGSRAFTICEGEAARTIVDITKSGKSQLKDRHIYGYVINGKEVINNIPYFLK